MRARIFRGRLSYYFFMPSSAQRRRVGVGSNGWRDRSGRGTEVGVLRVRYSTLKKCGLAMLLFLSVCSLLVSYLYILMSQVDRKGLAGRFRTASRGR